MNFTPQLLPSNNFIDKYRQDQVQIIMKKNLIFPTEIYEDFCYTVSNDQLLEECLTFQKNHSIGHIVSNMGGWQSQPLIEILSKNTEILLDHVINNLLGIYCNYGINRKPKLVNYWFNINYPGNYNISHNHTMSFFSVVYYVKVPKNSGELVLERSDDSSYYMQYFTDMNQYIAQAILVDPEEHKLVIFPSWIKHSVNQNRSNNNRISLAFNFV